MCCLPPVFFETPTRIAFYNVHRLQFVCDLCFMTFRQSTPTRVKSKISALHMHSSFVDYSVLERRNAYNKHKNRQKIIWQRWDKCPIDSTKASTWQRWPAAGGPALGWGPRLPGRSGTGSQVWSWSWTWGSRVCVGSEGESWSSGRSSSGRSVWLCWTWSPGWSRSRAGTRPGPGWIWAAERRPAGDRLCNPLCNCLQSLEGEDWRYD